MESSGDIITFDILEVSFHCKSCALSGNYCPYLSAISDCCNCAPGCTVATHTGLREVYGGVSKRLYCFQCKRAAID